MNDLLRRRFDRLMDEVLAELPGHILDLLEEVPLVVDDRPTADQLEEQAMDDDSELLGLHDGIPLTERSVQDSGVLPERIHIFRECIIGAATDQAGRLTDEALRHEIRTTVLHEIGHHFGMNEDDLADLGYE
jgi:predicted Zn-dependent protease with MMP-like domain